MSVSVILTSATKNTVAAAPLVAVSSIIPGVDLSLVLLGIMGMIGGATWIAKDAQDRAGTPDWSGWWGSIRDTAARFFVLAMLAWVGFELIAAADMGLRERIPQLAFLALLPRPLIAMGCGACSVIYGRAWVARWANRFGKSQDGVTMLTGEPKRGVTKRQSELARRLDDEGSEQ